MDLVNKLWGFCNKLRHDGVDSADYIEQLTYLLFLKMADEKTIPVPRKYDWQSLTSQKNEYLLSHLEAIFKNLSTKKGILGDIFAEPVSRVRNFEILRSLINEINSIHWTAFDADVIGLAFEELIGKVAVDGKKGAGQYFTPRPLIKTIVNVMKPDPIEEKELTVTDVAVGTAGFLVVAYEWFQQKYKNAKIGGVDLFRIQTHTYFGQELVQRPRRLALMNMFLHGVNANIKLGDSIYGEQDDNLYSCILTNPPFGNKGAHQVPNRQFPVKTSDKQLNFIQHIIEKLKHNGRAAIVLPDSCLSSEAARKIWSFYLDHGKSGKNVCNLHTVLKLPEGVFAAYANGVKACVIFLQKGKPTSEIWTYDIRKNNSKITTKSNSLSAEHFKNFEECFGESPNGASKRKQNSRFRVHTIEEVAERNYDISFTEIFTPVALPHPASIIDEMIADYERKIETLKVLKSNLPSITNGYTKTLEKNITSTTGNSSKREKTVKNRN